VALSLNTRPTYAYYDRQILIEIKELGTEKNAHTGKYHFSDTPLIRRNILFLKPLKAFTNSTGNIP